MNPNSPLQTWLESDDEELTAAIITDIRRHVSSIRKSGGDFYGYAVLPGDYCTQPNPATLVVAFNRESDLVPEHAHEVYYRYSVDEWSNYVHDEFDATKARLESLLENFRTFHIRSGDSFRLDASEVAFVAKIHRSILNALLELRRSGTFDDATYLVIWLSDSDHPTVNESAKILNNTTIYEQYASEFM